MLQVILKEKLWGTGSGNLTELERAINTQAALGYRLHTISTAASGSKGMGGGDRVQATMVFERLTDSSGGRALDGTPRRSPRSRPRSCVLRWRRELTSRTDRDVAVDAARAGAAVLDGDVRVRP